MKLRKQRRTKEVALDEDFKAGELPMEVADWAPDPEQRAAVGPGRVATEELRLQETASTSGYTV